MDVPVIFTFLLDSMCPEFQRRVQ